MSNFDLRYHAVGFSDRDEFEAVASDERGVRGMVTENLHHLASDNVSEEDLRTALFEAGQAYYDGYYSMHLASYAFALWFFHFDEDNWFGFETIREPVASYLSQSYLQVIPHGFVLFKGIDNGRILKGGISVVDVPVVINEQEMTFYMWAGELFD